MQDYVLNKVEYAYESIDEAFPPIDPGVEPFGSRVVVQIRAPKKKTKGGIILTDDTKDTEMWNTQVAKIIAIGALAFKNRSTQEPWPEGSWCEVGDFVRVPKYGGDKWSIRHGDDDTEILFVMFNDLDLLGKVTGDPLAMKAFV